MRQCRRGGSKGHRLSEGRALRPFRVSGKAQRDSCPTVPPGDSQCQGSASLSSLQNSVPQQIQTNQEWAESSGSEDQKPGLFSGHQPGFLTVVSRLRVVCALALGVGRSKLVITENKSTSRCE